jgi:hypothetical protein
MINTAIVSKSLALVCSQVTAHHDQRLRLMSVWNYISDYDLKYF